MKCTSKHSGPDTSYSAYTLLKTLEKHVENSPQHGLFGFVRK